MPFFRFKDFVANNHRETDKGLKTANKEKLQALHSPPRFSEALFPASSPQLPPEVAGA